MADRIDTPDRSLTALAVTVSRPDRVSPTLTPQQVARVATHGRRRSTTRGEVLIEAGGGRAVQHSAVATRRSGAVALLGHPERPQDSPFAPDLRNEQIEAGAGR